MKKRSLAHTTFVGAENLRGGNGSFLSHSPPNKSLDASGTSGLVIDNLSVTWLTAAASTQPFGIFPWRPNENQTLDDVGPTSYLHRVRQPSAKLQNVQTSIGQGNQDYKHGKN